MNASPSDYVHHNLIKTLLLWSSAKTLLSRQQCYVHTLRLKDDHLMVLFLYILYVFSMIQEGIIMYSVIKRFMCINHWYLQNTMIQNKCGNKELYISLIIKKLSKGMWDQFMLRSLGPESFKRTWLFFLCTVLVKEMVDLDCKCLELWILYLTTHKSIWRWELYIALSVKQ